MRSPLLPKKSHLSRDDISETQNKSYNEITNLVIGLIFVTTPVISNYFGTNAQVLTATTSIIATPSDPYLVIRASDFPTWGSATTGANNPQKWLTNILNKSYEFFQISANLSDQTINCVVTLAFVTLADRIVGSTITRKRQFSYAVDVFAPDAGSSIPDPDDI
jgi:hypothetical protein